MKNEKVNANSRRLLAIAIVAVIGFSFVACDDGGSVGGSIPAELVGRWGYIYNCTSDIAKGHGTPG